MASVKFVAVSRSLKGILDYVTNREKTEDRLITGINCVAQSALAEFMSVKKQFRKTEGRAYYHIVQAFSPDDPLDFDTAHEIGLKFAERFKGYQCLVVTHMNTAHIHNHIIMNSVSFETGAKFHQSAKEMQMVKEFCNELCREYGLSTTEAKADPFKPPKWKIKLRDEIRRAMEHADTREQFLALMRQMGYQVKWEPGQKHITYTTPEGIKCRDNKLFDETLLRENLESYFEMGGAAYLEIRQETAEAYGEPTPDIDDVVSGLSNALDALLGNDGPRFHMETIHHSDAKIERMLAQGRKISRTQVAVQDDDQDEDKRVEQELRYASLVTEELAWRAMRDDEEIEDEEQSNEEEYAQYHGFGWGGMGM